MALLLVAQSCGAGSTSSGGTGKADPPLTKVVLATGFTPSMNFAPYYLAAARGYYRQQGIDLQIQDGANTGMLEQVGRGQIDFGVTSGDSLLLAAASGVPDVMVMQQFTSSPVGAVSLASGKVSLHSPAGLKGLRVGVSAPNGSTYFGLLALLQAGGLSLHDIDLVSVGFTELEALSSGQIDVAMTYLNNEPVQAQSEGITLNQLPVSRYHDLVSQGLVTSRAMTREHSDLVRRFVRATLRGLRASLQDPAAAAQAALARMPGLTPQQTALQRRILTATQRFEQPLPSRPLGWIDPSAWNGTANFLRGAGVLKGTLTSSRHYSDRFLGS
ncbi:MAG: ABC transporter substrate-binding protein [Candidatus Dormibacteraeota bacterium]|nr:ABC transporter substrate-binding protein [Candidatus Dormibacteraeota bacterium]